MCIANTCRWLRSRVVVAAALLLPAASTHAHPAAQGRMELAIAEQRVELVARVSAEEVFTGVTLGQGAPEVATLDEVWRAYGTYLLRHVRLTADGEALSGVLVSGVPPAKTGADAAADGPGERAVYRFEFALPSGAKRLRIEQDALSEILYAPGNPWTASYVLRVALPGATPRDGLLLESKQPQEFDLTASPAAGADPKAPAVISQADVWSEFFRHGVWHILTGYDHLLFITALALAALTWWDLFKVVSVFTAAHTLTLVLSVLDLVRLPSRVVEPMIALSIVFIALHNFFLPRRTRGWARLAAAFGFGLFHGLGFAGGLLEAMAELPGTALASALAAFSVGVEAGHQCVVLPVFALVLLARRFGGEPWRLGALRWGSALIALAGAGYVVFALRGGS